MTTWMGAKFVNQHSGGLVQFVGYIGDLHCQ